MKPLPVLVLAATTLAAEPLPDRLARIRESINEYLGRPYVCLLYTSRCV